MVNKITCEQAQHNLKELCQEVVNNETEVIIQGEHGKDVVLVTADELDSLKETLYLLKSSANASRLFTALERSESNTLKPQTIEDFFADLDSED